jgi:hypothetical protein
MVKMVKIAVQGPEKDPAGQGIEWPWNGYPNQIQPLIGKGRLAIVPRFLDAVGGA